MISQSREGWTGGSSRSSKRTLMSLPELGKQPESCGESNKEARVLDWISAALRPLNRTAPEHETRLTNRVTQPPELPDSLEHDDLVPLQTGLDGAG